MLYPDESYRLLGACFEVHRDKGCGFLEPVYQEWLEIELAFQHIPFIARSGLILTYRGRQLRRTYRPDFLCHGKIIIEIKAVAAIIDAHRAQLINYLHATGYHLGLLVNFGGHPKLEYERLVLTEGKRKSTIGVQQQ